jgi:hypothetical protein
MPDDARRELERRWRDHLEMPFPYEWGELEEIFGWARDRAELRELEDATLLREAWGDPDLALYDTYVAGHVSTILMGSRSGAAVLGAAKADAPLSRYFDICEAEAAVDVMRQKVRTCRTYYEHLNQMLDVARAVKRRRG